MTRISDGNITTDISHTSENIHTCHTSNIDRLKSITTVSILIIC